MLNEPRGAGAIGAKHRTTVEQPHIFCSHGVRRVRLPALKTISHPTARKLMRRAYRTFAAGGEPAGIAGGAADGA